MLSSRGPIARRTVHEASAPAASIQLSISTRLACHRFIKQSLTKAIHAIWTIMEKPWPRRAERIHDRPFSSKHIKSRSRLTEPYLTYTIEINDARCAKI